MSEYDLFATSAYTKEGILGAPVFSVINIVAIEANNPDLGLVGETIRMAPGFEGLVTMDINGGPNICTDAPPEEAISFPDPCSWLGPNQINVAVTNTYGTSRLEFFIIVQDNFGFCVP